MTTPENSLGLQLEQLQIADSEPVQSASPDDSPQAEQSKKKQKPYINPERFKTGGAQREKPSDEELAERMQRIKAQNEKIKQRRLDVEADEEAFRKTQQEERVKIAHARKVQETVNHAREQNAVRKMERIETREWDSGKPASATESKTVTTPSPLGSRGGSRGRPGRGTRRGRGGRGMAQSRDNTAQPVSPPQLPSQDESRDTAS